jgi:methionyl-tRNA formyltransferase
MAAIDWSRSAESLHCHVRGFQPWPKAFTTNKGEELKIVGIEAVDADWLPASAFDVRVEPGMVVDFFKTRGFVVRTGGERGALLVTRVQPPGKPEMGAWDYVNGGALEIGTVLGQ